MNDNIKMTRTWQDPHCFQITFECENDLISAKAKVYLSEQNLDEFTKMINLFVEDPAISTEYAFGERGNRFAPAVEFLIQQKDALGHILIEVYMEINDGGSLDTHHCCFFVATELGLLQQFGIKVQTLKRPDLGTSATLNEW